MRINENFIDKYSIKAIARVDGVPFVYYFETLQEAHGHCEKLCELIGGDIKIDIVDCLSGCEFHFD